MGSWNLINLFKYIIMFECILIYNIAYCTQPWHYSTVNFRYTWFLIFIPLTDSMSLINSV